MGRKAFVTGGTGSLGSNLVRSLLQDGWAVRALVRSRQKAEQQLAGLPVEIVEGDIADPWKFTMALRDVDALFHTAAYFRESLKGGSHRKQLHAINVVGTRKLLEAAYSAGVRRFVQTSSIAVVTGPKGAVIDESMARPDTEQNDYFRSKILADREVDAFLKRHPDFFAVFVLPGWMHGPYDVGPTSAGQTTLDFLHRKLPGVPPGTVSFVDVRDAVAAHLAALDRGQRGRRYLAAGRSMSMQEVFRELEAVTGVPAPRGKLPLPVLFAVAVLQELRARLTGAPALLSLATVRLLVQENGRSHFSDKRYREELGLSFRPVSQTLHDEVTWYRESGWIQTP